jgi:lysozyme family protein
MTVDDILNAIVAAEGGYVNDPRDAGGATNWGITEIVARANGWQGRMQDLPRGQALAIYRKQYVENPGFALLLPISQAIAAECVDTGVNMGPRVAATFLQRTLNALNRQGKDWADIVADGAVGAGTAAALKQALAVRGAGGEAVILKALNALQGARYIELAESRAANEAFLYGWLANRVSL